MSVSSIPILMYHSVASERKGAKLRGLSVSPFLFKVQLYTLKLLGYKGLSLTKLIPYLTGKRKGRVFGITFDDGYQNNFTKALPILVKLNFTATCYIVADNINGTNYWDIDKGVSKKKMMSDKEISNWIGAGMEIGSHSSNHVKLSKCKSEILKKEIFDSKETLEKKFKVSVNHFCFPYGDFSEMTIRTVKEAGYKSAVTVKRGKALVNADFYTLPRVLVNHRTYPHLLILKVMTHYENRR